MNEFEQVVTEGFKSLFEMVEAYVNGDDIDRELLDKIHGGETE